MRQGVSTCRRRGRRPRLWRPCARPGRSRCARRSWPRWRPRRSPRCRRWPPPTCWPASAAGSRRARRTGSTPSTGRCWARCRSCPSAGRCWARPCCCPRWWGCAGRGTRAWARPRCRCTRTGTRSSRSWRRRLWCRTQSAGGRASMPRPLTAHRPQGTQRAAHVSASAHTFGMPTQQAPAPAVPACPARHCTRRRCSMCRTRQQHLLWLSSLGWCKRQARQPSTTWRPSTSL
mmetsp:Transcript_14498/g.36071  ORF Transcript_14498/g.36071 Transcript_14498/m.36071 type:complete len:232 (+) Transcript_14498:885-1580(+)